MGRKNVFEASGANTSVVTVARIGRITNNLVVRRVPSLLTRALRALRAITPSTDGCRAALFAEADAKTRAAGVSADWLDALVIG